MSCPSLLITIGDLPVLIQTQSPELMTGLRRRFEGFTDAGSTAPVLRLQIEVGSSGRSFGKPITVRRAGNRYQIARDDFTAELSLDLGTGVVRQLPMEWITDTVLRAAHTLLLARVGGFLLHASSILRDGTSQVFTGLSGAGKTTIASLRPSNSLLLSDEISYIRERDGCFIAFGTPFYGELARPGDNVSAPVSALYFLEKGHSNATAPMPVRECARRFMRNVLFFSPEREMAAAVFATACRFMETVPCRRLTFSPDPSVFEVL